ncbi:hypothetical protein NBO_66g0005 [Nosema bombycis CQ1]|uniref:Uncharacterized protein n=1 Tax=Nosema bombycis (strain CQ1 / CVCC 102059) TaxID=578461 RepID=R0MHC8_NOSB1|nr:hypothetical protein NBO_66g0005 [Nosema bombycis CQ1]|eukprot:EOB13545.1 hypothetical protein NBO_66g0005 [Nosema bombycis CQ1]
MRSIFFYFNYNVVFVLKSILCAEFACVTATQESIKCQKDNQNMLMEAEILELDKHQAVEMIEDNCNSTDDENSDYENENFERSTINYLKKILEELKDESSNVTESFNRSHFLEYIDKSIKLIDLFNTISSYYKDSCSTILAEKMNRVILNFNLFDRTFLEIKEVINESVNNCEEKNVKNLSEVLISFETRVEAIKAEFEQYKEFQEKTAKFDFTFKVNVLNEHKKSLDDFKPLVNPMSDEEIEDRAECFLNGILKVVSGFYESLSECLESDYKLFLKNWEILINILIDSGKCSEDLNSFMELYS